uniref:VPS37 C-terminal domain-containing protein n=1 Tax=Clastoptera arizonana TaxID=38151 RepID=A0A1B6DTB1_9HEMI
MSFRNNHDDWYNVYHNNKQHKIDYKSAVGLLEHLNDDELRELLNDEGKFENMVKDIKDLKNLETEKEILMASNRSLAEFNLSQEPHMEKGKQKLYDLIEEGERLCNDVELKTKKIMNKAGSQSLETILALLQTAAAEMEEESETISEKFLNGELEVENFLEQFSLRRKLMHLRKVKSDKMSEMVSLRSSVSSQQRMEINTNLIGSSYYNTQPLVAPSSVPYPIGPVTGMPMPGMFSNHFPHNS